ncbi:MAG: ATPase, T2SS/T4P/T4SS family, partial [Nitrospirales bacterium]|nr:Flp pilus assembly complex ATPase component TadA [Nitrospirales bacterium]
MNRELVGHQLVDARVISSEDLNKALELQQWEGGRLGSILIRMGVLSEATLLEFLSQRYGVPTVELSTCTLDDTLKGLMSLELMQQHLICPVKKTASRLSVAMVDPTNSALLDELRFRTGLHIIPMVATETAVRLALQQFQLPAGQSAMPNVEDFPVTSGLKKNGHAGDGSENKSVQPRDGRQSGTVSPVIAQDSSAGDVVNGLLQQAIGMDASDLHIEPLEKILRVRVRLDGELRPLTNLPKELHPSLIARLKILSNMDIAERRLPQDGRMKVELFPQVDIRVAMLPCLNGEKAVLRLLNQGGLSLHVTNLGLEQADLDLLTTALENPYGMILVTGPTGSGKTTTLYSALQFLN